MFRTECMVEFVEKGKLTVQLFLSFSMLGKHNILKFLLEQFLQLGRWDPDLWILTYCHNVVPVCLLFGNHP